MKIFNTGKKRIRKEYYVRMAEKYLWLRIYNITNSTKHILNPPTYIFPDSSMRGSFHIVWDAKIGWESKNEADRFMQKHIDEQNNTGFNSTDRFDFNVVKITIIEEIL